MTVLLMAAWPVAVAWVVLKGLGHGLACSERHQLALASGGLVFFVVLAPIQEFDPARLDDMTGMTLVGAGILVLLAWLAWRVRLARPASGSRASDNLREQRH